MTLMTKSELFQSCNEDDWTMERIDRLVDTARDLFRQVFEMRQELDAQARAFARVREQTPNPQAGLEQAIFPEIKRELIPMPQPLMCPRCMVIRPWNLPCKCAPPAGFHVDLPTYTDNVSHP